MAAQGSVETFEEFVLDVGEKEHNLSTDTHKISLHTTLPDTATASPTYGDFTGTEVANGNGYTTTGATANVTYAEADGTGTLTLGTDVTWTQNGAGPTDIEAGVLYSDTATAKEAIATVEMTVDAGTTPISLQDGDITIQAGTILTIAKA
jgi:hypothetical protein